ncbi:SH3 domain-containing protein [Streptomyces sp. NPDC008238]
MAENNLDEARDGVQSMTATTGAAATAGQIFYAVAPGCRLNVRSGPGTSFHIVKVLPYDVKVPVFCQTPGTTVSGYYGTSKIWDCIGEGQFVSDAYVQTGSDGYIASRCS